MSPLVYPDEGAMLSWTFAGLGLQNVPTLTNLEGFALVVWRQEADGIYFVQYNFGPGSTSECKAQRGLKMTAPP